MNKFRKYHRFVLVLGLFLILLFVVVACSGSSAPSAESEAEAEYQVMLPAVDNDPIAGSAYPEPENQSQVGEASVSNEAYPPSEEPTEAPAPSQRTELSATNPARVSLASGEIQLIEFFAYW